MIVILKKKHARLVTLCVLIADAKSQCTDLYESIIWFRLVNKNVNVRLFLLIFNCPMLSIVGSVVVSVLHRAYSSISFFFESNKTANEAHFL